MDTSSDLGLADRFQQALHALDRDGEAAVPAMAALFSPGATIDNPALTLADDDRRGDAGVEAFWTGYARLLHGARTEFHAVTEGEASIGLFWTTRRPGQGEAAPLFYEGATLLRTDAGGNAVEAMRGYYDTRAFDAPPR